MNSYERIINRLNREPVDKIPNLNIVMAFAAKQIGAAYSEFVTNFKILVEGNIYCCEQFGIDAVSAISDPMREAHSFGADIVIPINDVPYSKVALLSDYSQLKTLKPLSPYDDIRTLDRIMAIELYNKQVKHKYAIIGWIEGALAEAADLRDISQLMMDLILDPEAVTELFDIIYEQQKSFAAAQIKAGADIIGIGDAAASLVGPDLYEMFVLPYEQRIIKDIHDMGAKVKLHICGDITSILNLVKQTNADIVDVDWMVNFKTAVKSFSDCDTAVCGNIDPVSVFLQGDTKTVHDVVNSCKMIADSKTIIAGGCEIPRETPVSNMKYMNEILYL